MGHREMGLTKFDRVRTTFIVRRWLRHLAALARQLIRRPTLELLEHDLEFCWNFASEVILTGVHSWNL